jgi:hypothetical protein
MRGANILNIHRYKEEFPSFYRLCQSVFPGMKVSINTTFANVFASLNKQVVFFFIKNKNKLILASLLTYGRKRLAKATRPKDISKKSTKGLI